MGSHSGWGADVHILPSYCFGFIVPDFFFLLLREKNPPMFSMFFSLKHTHRLRNTPTGEEQGGEGGPFVSSPWFWGRQLVG